MNVLFIGNSYTYCNDMPKLFEQLANSNGKNITVHSVTEGGRRLRDYADDKDPITVMLDALLFEQKFDICFIQEQSILPAADFDRFIGGLDCVVKKLKNRAERLILYATWGRKDGSEILTEHNWTTESMNHILSDAYQRGSELYGTEVSGVGNSFLYVTQNYPEINLYHEDLSHPSYQGSCLAALTHYYVAFNEFPSQTDALSLSDAELSAFKSAILQ
ncbi:MAG: hypothetical protein IKU10_00730 [Clostridia bacterium]|nr:hypothetical protein [Clostridia bacterium]